MQENGTCFFLALPSAFWKYMPGKYDIPVARYVWRWFSLFPRWYLGFGGGYDSHTRSNNYQVFLLDGWVSLIFESTQKVVGCCFSRAVGGLVSRKPSPNEKWGRNRLPPGVRRPINLKVIRTFWEDFLGGVILPVWHPMTSFRTAWTALLVPLVMVSQEVGEVPWKRINPISG